MLRDITIGQHFPGNSLVHRFDPRLKILLTILYIVLLFAAANPLGLALSIAWLAVLYKMAKIPVRMISYGGSNYNISFLVKAEDKKRTLQALSETLFKG